ncbi:MAG: A24 family peptidase [Alphaproteobacteria bacterium]|nr:A24 family peptidase [Alphaproteobacteria bacterium]
MHSFIGDIIFLKRRKKRKKKTLHLKRQKLLKDKYFFVKIASGVLLTLTLLSYYYLLQKSFIGTTGFIMISIFVFLGFIAFFIDAKHYLIPDVLTLPMLLTGLYLNEVYALTQTGLESIISVIATYILCTAVALIFYKNQPDAFGGGDVKLLTAFAALVPLEYIGWILVGTTLLAVPYSKATQKKAVPMAVFAVPAFLIALLVKIALN